MGVPVFISDVKGDVAGIAMPGTINEKIQQRVNEIGIEGYVNEPSPSVFWDIYGKMGHPVL
jgi:DNA helicase HerA-like ATPase